MVWKLADFIYNQFDKISKNPAKNGDDIILVANQMWQVVMIPFIIFISYNWFYLMFLLDKNNKPLKDEFPKKVIDFVESNFFVGLFTSLVKPMVITDIFLRWGVQFIWRGVASLFKEIAF
jgi:hypothetical protein